MLARGIWLRSRLRGRLTARVDFDFQAAYDELNPADDDYLFYAALAASAGVSRAELIVIARKP